MQNNKLDIVEINNDTRYFSECIRIVMEDTEYSSSDEVDIGVFVSPLDGGG